MKHRENPAFQCMASGCGKKFFRKPDLNAHVPVHSGILHRCDHPGCTYSNIDKRLVTGHKRVHSANMRDVMNHLSIQMLDLGIIIGTISNSKLQPIYFVLTPQPSDIVHMCENKSTAPVKQLKVATYTL